MESANKRVKEALDLTVRGEWAGGSDLGLELPRAIGLINRAPRATMGGSSSNELMFGMVLEEDQHAFEE